MYDEYLKDTDGDGIADYLDNEVSCTILLCLGCGDPVPLCLSCVCHSSRYRASTEMEDGSM